MTTIDDEQEDPEWWPVQALMLRAWAVVAAREGNHAGAEHLRKIADRREAAWRKLHEHDEKSDA